MTDQILEPEHDDDQPTVGGRRRKRRGFKSCLAVLVALAVVVGGFYFVVTKGVDLLRSQFSSAQDFEGPGRGKVTFQVSQGDSIAQIGRDLKDKKVVASVQAFLDAANANPDSTGIQVGYYQLKKEMQAADALKILVDPGNIIKSTVTIPEGLRVKDIVALLADKTDFSAAAYNKLLANPSSIGLPDYANGNAEGYLFPSTYDFGPDATAKSILQTMVKRWQQAADDADLTGAADRLGYTPAQIMIVASLVEAEAGSDDDRGKVARVIYNRLEGDETNGLLQIDASVNYGLQQKLGVALTTEQLQQDTPYNTYTRPGLPPTPIEAPGDAAIAAAANPTEGPWFYYVTVNLRTGETKFATTYDEFLSYKREFEQYCETSDAC
ncbi:endolytic transglycosylase MltG [Nocardioides sp. KIGAM211]|uniref:Endolytic murein transglycosylase n=1 Tax=Nocardioides luti TaxID=2761101 RepID=A0A7X0RJK2_9ACTN|nr:endolytic transglycosylase MltG [Nocardioides luti]MBB6629499.1 endolytic transglycosylase MltG [Nocardioides luti]